MKEYNDEIVIRLNDGRYLAAWFSLNPAYAENCDACIGYTLYSDTKEALDGGEMDYNSSEKNYKSIEDVLFDIIDFATDTDIGYDPVPVSYDVNEFDEGGNRNE